MSKSRAVYRVVLEGEKPLPSSEHLAEMIDAGRLQEEDSRVYDYDIEVEDAESDKPFIA